MELASNEQVRAGAEWRRGQQSLAAARLCQSNGFYADAISRAYYAVMHAAKSLLELRGITVDTHAGVRSYFGRFIVRTRLVEPEWSDLIRQLGGLRILADYDAQAAFTEDDAQFACDRADAFLARILELLPPSVPSS